MPKRCPPWWKQTCQEHLAQATCRAKACRAHLQSAAPAKHPTLPVHAVMPNYPELRWSRTTLHASTRPALREPSTLHCVRILWCYRPPCEKKMEQSPDLNQRLLAVRSNHWAKLALMPWDNMANSGRKLVTMARPFQKRLQVCSSCAACRAPSFFSAQADWLRSRSW